MYLKYMSTRLQVLIWCFDKMIHSSCDDTHVLSFTTILLDLKIRYSPLYLDGAETPYSLVFDCL